MKQLWPDPVPLKGYAGGTFRWLEERHAGALCILPTGIFAWRPQTFADVREEDFEPFIEHRAEVDFLLFGCGSEHLPPPDWVVRLAALAGLGLEVMTTGAAVRTYNLCRDELRLPATFLLPTDAAS
jgi:uncharacterized protein